MESTSVFSCRACYCYRVRGSLVSRDIHVSILSKASRIVKTLSTNHYNSNFSATRHYVKKQISRKTGDFLQGLNSTTETSEFGSPEGEVVRVFEFDSQWGISSNMRLGELKATLGQRLNFEGLAYAIRIFYKDKKMAIPHVRVPDIRYIDWIELKHKGFEGVVFDKDNTITAPYSLSLWPPLQSSMAECKSVFGKNIGVFSNSAGLLEYDPDGIKAKAVEDATGINVIRHGVKKPAGTADEIERHFGCESSRLIMVGDRLFTDIVYGNRNGFFTILTDPLSLAEEHLIVRQVRLLELTMLKLWSKQGMSPAHHKLISDTEKCVKGHPLC